MSHWMSILSTTFTFLRIKNMIIYARRRCLNSQFHIWIHINIRIHRNLKDMKITNTCTQNRQYRMPMRVEFSH